MSKRKVDGSEKLALDDEKQDVVMTEAASMSTAAAAQSFVEDCMVGLLL